jgi:hypothetical protein
MQRRLMDMGSKRFGETKWTRTRTPKRPAAGDKRVAHRHTLALDTEVHFSEQFVRGMFRCRTGNIGLNGAFLPSKNIPLTRKTAVELVFHARARSQPKRYCMNAKVVRASEEGAALVFCPDNEKQIQDFRRFLLKAKVAHRR